MESSELKISIQSQNEKKSESKLVDALEVRNSFINRLGSSAIDVDKRNIKMIILL